MSWHTNPVDSNGSPDLTWLSHQFFFYDEKKQYRSIRIADVVNDAAQLNYTYADDTTCCQQPPQGAPAVAGSSKPLTTEAVTVRTRAAAPREAVPAAPTARYRLHLTNISYPEGSAAKVRIFIEKPDANASTDVADPHYVGYFVVVPHRRGDMTPMHRHTSHEYTFDLLPEQAQFVKDPANVQVTLVPAGQGKNKPKRVSISVGDIYVEVVNPKR